MNDKVLIRTRIPRPFGHDKILEEYDHKTAEGYYLLHCTDEGKPIALESNVFRNLF